MTDSAVPAPLSPVAVVSSLLFVSAKPLSFDALLEATELQAPDLEAAIEELRHLFQDDLHGFCLAEVAGGFQFRSSPRAAVAIKRLLPPKSKRLSRAAAETLAVIAYKQPVERSEIEAIRGVDSLPTIRTLLDAKLIRIVGNQDTPGRPALYGTTTAFLEKFGLRDLSQLPSLRELDQLLREDVAGEAEIDEPTVEAQLS